MSTQEPIRVVIVDDHALVRLSLRTLLLTADDLAVVGHAADGEEALRVCGEVHPDVVLMDLRLPGMDGIATIRALQRHDPVPHVLVLTATYDERRIAEALAAGASGYLLKDFLTAELIAAIHAVHVRR